MNIPANTSARVSVNVNDLTDFESGLNGWTLPAGNPSKIVRIDEDTNSVLFGNNETTVIGVVLTKTLNSLEPGKRYRVSYKSKKSHNIPNLPENIPSLKVMTGNDEIISRQFLAHQSWREYEGEFTASSNTATIDFVSVSDSPLHGFGNYHLDDIRVRDYFDDLTDFNDSTTGLWRTTNVSETARFVNSDADHGIVYQLPTYSTGVNHGDILIRTVQGLIPGKTYTFSVDARRDIGQSQAPLLSLVLEGMVIGERFTPVTNTWNTYSREFIATGEQHSLAIRSHESTSAGNDYSLDNLRIVERS